MSIQKYYTDIFTVDVLTTTKSASGVIKNTYVTSTDQKGKIDPVSAPQVFMMGGKEILITHNLFCSTSVSIKQGDIVNFGTKKYDVIEVINPFNKNHHLEVKLVSR